MAVDLKRPDGRDAVLALADSADALIEGFRPGVMERLGLGPDDLHARNPRLVYGRMTGYGPGRPAGAAAGHDINYISLSGALGASRRRGAPDVRAQPGRRLRRRRDVAGLRRRLCAARGSQLRHGQVVDAAMVDGSALLTTMVHALRAAGAWNPEPGTNLLDSGAHFYEVYATADGGHVAVGAIEPQFYARLLELLEMPAAEMPQCERDAGPSSRSASRAVFAARTPRHWRELLERGGLWTIVRGRSTPPIIRTCAARETFVESTGSAAGAGAALQPHARPGDAARHDRRRARSLGAWISGPRPR